MKVPSMIETKVKDSLKGSILDLIQRDYQFIAGDKIQEMFANDFLEVVNQIADGHPTLKGRVCKGRPLLFWE